MTANIVVDLGFGDGGKGITVDFICSQIVNSSSTIVVRTVGGQQAGHTVMTGGKKHVFSNFGSGTLRGVPTYFSEHCCFYLNTIFQETELMKSKGITPTKLFLHPLAKVTTPYDVAFNRVIEKRNLHGSCGLGVGATMKRYFTTGHKLHAADLQNVRVAQQKLVEIKKYYENQLLGMGISFDEYFEEYHVGEHNFMALLQKLPYELMGYTQLRNYANLIFEGAQGIMLDMDHGIFPNVTYANTTCKNALDVLKKLNYGGSIGIWYVTRCYQTRHGNGWMSVPETDLGLINTEEEINVNNPWQSYFRIGELDYDLLNHSLKIDNSYVGDISNSYYKKLVVTCLDQRPGFTFQPTKLTTKFTSIYTSHSPDSKDFKRFL